MPETPPLLGQTISHYPILEKRSRDGRCLQSGGLADRNSRDGFTAARKRMAAVEEEQSRSAYVDPAWIASTYAILGDKDRAFACLGKAASVKSVFLDYMEVEPSYDPWRSDPRYDALIRRSGLPR